MWIDWQAFSRRARAPLATLVALFGLTACTSTTTEEGVACAAPSLFVADGSGPTLVTTSSGTADLNRLTLLERQGCEVSAVLAELDAESVSEREQRRIDIAEALFASGRTELAIVWFERADSFAAYQRLLSLHTADGPLADDAAYLRYEVKRAQLQQAFGEQVEWPSLSQAQPLFVVQPRTLLLGDTDPEAEVIEGLSLDDRVYLLDVVVLADGESYWVQAYYPQTLALGWIEAEALAQYPAHVRERLGALDNDQGRTYAQQLLFSALIHGMNLSPLTPLTSSDFFGGAQAQQQNSVALLQRLGRVTDACLAETEQLEQTLAYYLMDEGPAPDPQQAPYSDDMRVALAALTGTSSSRTSVADDDGLDDLRTELSTFAHEYFRIRVQGRVEQRLCHSLPNAAGDAAYADPSCAAVSELQACVNRVDAIFSE